MGSRVGWILDVYIEGSEAVTWLRTEDGRALRLTDDYRPELYVLPKDVRSGQGLLPLLQQEARVLRADWAGRYAGLHDKRRRQLIRVRADSALTFRRLIKGLEASDQVQELFNTDLLHVQQYLFNQLKIEPTSKVEVHYDSSFRIESVVRVDDSKEIQPPPFTALYFDIHSAAPSLVNDTCRDPIGAIEVSFGEEEAVLKGKEDEVINDFEGYVRERDPDFLACPSCDDFAFPYLFNRSLSLGLNPKLGREAVDLKKLRRPLPYWLRGRVALDYDQFGYTLEEWGIAGLVERARFSFLPPGIAGRWTSNRIVDSRNCFELTQRGYVIPRDTGYYEYVRPMEEIFSRDKGGMIIAPRIGVVHENVAELDYESQYPNLIVKECISYETVTPKGIKRREDALLPHNIRRVLGRRLYFKGMRGRFERFSQMWRWCEQRQSALKLILVTSYGTSGCCWNRFGNVLAFEEINRRSREVMVRTKDLAQAMGFEVVYADTDSIFVKKEGATKGDYEGLAEHIGGGVGLPISLDHHYRFLLLLPLEADPEGRMEAQKHYFGVTNEGEIIARGIELRRHDTPRFIKEFQQKLIATLFGCSTADEVAKEGYERALQLVTKAIDQVMMNDMPLEELIVSRALRKPVAHYKSMFPHVSAALQLAGHGKTPKLGEAIDFVYTDADHHNPLCRVLAYDLVQGAVNVDREKYREMVLDAAETVLSQFGFTRDLGYEGRVRPWFDELHEEERREAKMEVE